MCIIFQDQCKVITSTACVWMCVVWWVVRFSHIWEYLKMHYVRIKVNRYASMFYSKNTNTFHFLFVNGQCSCNIFIKPITIRNWLWEIQMKYTNSIVYTTKFLHGASINPSVVSLMSPSTLYFTFIWWISVKFKSLHYYLHDYGNQSLVDSKWLFVLSILNAL